MKSIKYRVKYNEKEIKRRLRIKGPITLRQSCKAKGTFFEKDFRDDLENSKMFGKIIHDGSSGAKDICSFDDDNLKIFVFSLKCLDIKNKMRTINSEEFQPEINFAKKMFFEYPKYQIVMVVVILDNSNNQLHIFDNYDYKQSKPVIINKF